MVKLSKVKTGQNHFHHKAVWLYGAAVSNQQRTVLADFGRAWRTMCLAFDSITSYNGSWIVHHTYRVGNLKVREKSEKTVIIQLII